ncbi:acid phosphatase 1-like [Phalaenopsis equestris]|uniref:acid phosphatase 1-like n=1 Tax=Phalaenopsis equestris TaxID=78828 RepID=UPI0009E36A99|nr:acid phosphatase 1-like [Phalaenopsis equestris]
MSRLPLLHLILLSSILYKSSAASNKAADTLLRLLPPAAETLNSNVLVNVAGDDPNEAYCESWRLSVETNNAGNWKKISSRCASSVEAYVRGPQYALDSKVVSRLAQNYAKNIRLAGDGMDSWIFDVDETLLSNIHHYFAWEVMNETVAAEQWGASTKSPALPWSLWLYKKLQGMGFQLILLTGRKETHRNSTEQNLLAVGYHSWEKLILRGNLDAGKRAMAYKSEKRAELVAQGYRIHGSSGDQWSDLMGEPMARRSFKVPNPMYHIP